MKYFPQLKINRIIITFFLIVLIFSIVACNETLLDDPDAENKSFETDFKEGDSLAAECLDLLGQEALDLGLTNKQIVVLQDGALARLEENDLTDSVDISQIVPDFIIGAESAISDKNAGLDSDSDKQTAIAAIVAASIKSLENNISLSDQLTELSGHVTDPSDRFNGNPSKWLNSVGYLDLLSYISSYAMAYLDEAGISQSKISATSKTVLENITSHLNEIGIVNSQLPAIVKSITTGAVGSTDDAGLKTDDLNETLKYIFTGIFDGLNENGLANDVIADLADDASEGAVLALVAANIGQSYYNSLISEIIAQAKAGLLAAGVSQDEVDAVEATISSAVFDAKNTITGSDIFALGKNHSCLRTDAGKVLCWGKGDHGVLGRGDSVDIGDEPDEMGDNLIAISLGTGKTAVEISSGDQFTCAILNDHTLKCWGNNDHGQLGLGDVDDRGDNLDEMGDNLPTVDLGTGRTAKHISCGDAFACAILDDNSVKCWGYNTHGQLGIGDTEDRGDEADKMGDNLPTVDLGTGHTAKQISAGYYHACAILDNDSIKCWGYDNYGQLGFGDVVDRGDEADEMGDNLPAVDLGTGRTATFVATGSYHTCALLDNSMLKCWGHNLHGLLGQESVNDIGDEAGEMGDNLPAVDLGTDHVPYQIAAGASHTCARTDIGEVKCWGWKLSGRLGIDTDQDIGDDSGEMGDNLETVNLGTDRTIIELAVGKGGSHNCARLDNDTIKCWGNNYYGQLGLGDGGSDAHRGDFVDENDNYVDEMGDNLEAVDVEFN